MRVSQAGRTKLRSTGNRRLLMAQHDPSVQLVMGPDVCSGLCECIMVITYHRFKTNEVCRDYGGGTRSIA